MLAGPLTDVSPLVLIIVIIIIIIIISIIVSYRGQTRPTPVITSDNMDKPISDELVTLATNNIISSAYEPESYSVRDTDIIRIISSNKAQGTDGYLYYDDIKETIPSGTSTVRNNALGNFLVSYFTGIAWYFVNGLDASINIEYHGPHIEYIKHLPSFIQYNPIIADRLIKVPYIRKKVSDGGLQISDWAYNRGVLRAMIPLMVDLTKPFLAYSSAGVYDDGPSECDIVIHFRCSDAPRNRHNDYMFQRFKWYESALNEASKRLNKHTSQLSILILSCAEWGANDPSKQNLLCSAVVQALITYIKEKDLNNNVVTQCGSVADDFLSMMKAPCLISPGSSLSYMAAFASSNVVITPNYLHIHDTYYRDNWIMLPSEELAHATVPDYDNISDVLIRLRQ